jgi:hypothetical protein
LIESVENCSHASEATEIGEFAEMTRHLWRDAGYVDKFSAIKTLGLMRAEGVWHKMRSTAREK